MRTNKPIVFTLIFSLLAIAFKLSIFYGGWQTQKIGILSHIAILLAMLPFVAFLIIQIRKEQGGEIGGKEAFKEGLKFVVLSAVLISVFNYVFYEMVLGEYIRNYIAEKGPIAFKEVAARANKAITDAEIKSQVELRIKDATAFKDTTGKLFSMVMSGAFFTFLSAFVLKRKV